MSTQRRALIVDDDADIRALISAILAKAGYRTNDADRGGRAIAEAHQNRPDVYVLDVRMPGMNGLDVCRLLKADRRTEAPVLLVSANATPADIEAGYEAGCDAYLAKPFKASELLHRLNELLGCMAA
jgi:DNA-binding response OmpR family regulator